MYFQARYYDASTGEFLSRDPLEYVDGMSLYRAYFVPGAMDPEGLEEEDCVPSVELTLKPEGPDGAPYGFADLPEDGNQFVMGVTKFRDDMRNGFPVKCVCEECCPGTHCIRCSLNLELFILLDENNIEEVLPGERTERIYGHEQRHVLNYIRAFQDLQKNTLEIMNLDFPCEKGEFSELVCRTRAETLEESILERITAIKLIEKNHLNPSPVHGRPYDPIPQIGPIVGPSPIPEWAK